VTAVRHPEPVEFAAVCPHGVDATWSARQEAYPPGTAYLVTVSEPECSCPAGVGEAA
jgi:hypothetical protein